MDNIRLPDLNRINDVKKRLKTLPPQKSDTDTSNWENRDVSAPVVDTENKKLSVRKLDFMRPLMVKGLTLDQIRKIEKNRINKSSK